ncbi:MAG TPA: AAA family ATPase [Planctomycetaceae bacterium]
MIHGATGTPVLGYEKFAVPRPFRSAFVSMESGGATIRANARSICHSLGCRLSDLDGMVWWQLDSLKISDPGTLTALRREIERKQLELLVVDPLYLAIDLDADDSKSVYQMGKRLTAVGTLIRDTGCVVALIHHGIKRPQDPYRPMKLNDLSGAGVTEWAGQWGLISRRGEYDEERPGHHELWYRAGGRDFPGSLLAIDIDEFSPFGERREWRVSVRPASEVAAEMIEASEAAKLSQRQASEAAEARHYVDRYAAKVVGWLRRHPGGGSASDIRNSCGMAPKAWRLVLGHLLESEQIVECRYRAGNGHEYPGFRAADGDPDSSGFDSDSPGQSGSDGARSTDTDSPSLEGNPSPRVRPRKRGRSHDSRANKQRGGES